MGEFRFLILVLQFTAVTAAPLSFIVRAGDDVNLPCGNVINSQDKCRGTSWLSSRSLGETKRELITLGQISKSEIGKAKSDRLSVTADCSLVIKKVTRDDVGRYNCRQFDESGQKVSDSKVHLSVVDMTEHEYNDTVILDCSVWTYDGCKHTVEWLYEGDKRDVGITFRTCEVSVRLPPHPNQKSKYYELLKCNVTDKKNGETLLCDVGPQSSYEERGWWGYIIVSVGLATLIISVVTVNIWKRTKGSQTQVEDNAVHHDEDEGSVTYENVGEPSASIRLH
ncbi:uncharacterized protein LOC125896889 [Epinephelus fuscoguttatus]|uniref:uncharacterized protein LOC125896889 n=1 Tax=Epinephelus fuscoguttatus TaxID=293821 RepID=UPI0020D16AFE|nr:uncharacterized protein LOC125896889 [Epinephelus fuscoguttatus]